MDRYGASRLNSHAYNDIEVYMHDSKEENADAASTVNNTGNHTASK